MSFTTTHRGLDSYVRGIVQDATDLDQNAEEHIVMEIADDETTRVLFAAKDAVKEAWNITDRNESFDDGVSSDDIRNVEAPLKQYIKDRAQTIEGELQ